MTKPEIREISKKVYGLATADKPSTACLASRIPYGSEISDEKLRQVGAMEAFLRGRGVRVCRARHHGPLLRIELDPEGAARLADRGLTEAVIEQAKELGFTYVTLDLEGYRTGSMNEILDRRDS